MTFGLLCLFGSIAFFLFAAGLNAVSGNWPGALVGIAGAVVEVGVLLRAAGKDP